MAAYKIDRGIDEFLAESSFRNNVQTSENLLSQQFLRIWNDSFDICKVYRHLIKFDLIFPTSHGGKWNNLCCYKYYVCYMIKK